MTQLRIGQKLRQIRYVKSLSLKQVVQLICIDYTAFSKIEKEERHPQIISTKAFTFTREIGYKELQICYLKERSMK